MVIYIYLVLLILMTVCMYWSGKRMQKNNSIFLKAALPGIIAFTLNEGLRFGRGVDYNTYAFGQFDDILRGSSDVEMFDWLFVLICRFLISLGGEWQSMVLVMSFTLVVAVSYFIYHHAREVAPIALVLFALLYRKSPENLARWYFALSFVLMGLTLYLKQKNKKALILFVFFSFVGFSNHFGIAIVAIMYLIINCYNKIFLKPSYSIFLYFAIAILFRTEFMAYFMDIAQILSFLNAEKTDIYMNNADRWFVEGGSSSLFNENGYMPFSLFGIYVIGIIIGFYVAKSLNKPELNFIYNCFSLGFILYPIGAQNEIASRFLQCFQIFGFIIIGYALYYAYKKRDVFKIKPIWRIVIFLCLLNQGRVIFINPLRDTIPEHYLYVWDSHGRKGLDNWTYYIAPYLNK